MNHELKRAALQLAIDQERAVLQDAYEDVRVTMHRVASPPELRRRLKPALPYLVVGIGLMLLVRTRRHGLKAALVLPAIELWQLWHRLALPPTQAMPALAPASRTRSAAGGGR